MSVNDKLPIKRKVKLRPNSINQHELPNEPDEFGNKPRFVKNCDYDEPDEYNEEVSNDGDDSVSNDDGLDKLIEEPCIEVEIDGELHTLTPALLIDSEEQASFLDLCNSAKSPVTVFVNRMLKQTDLVRVDCFALLKELRCKCQFIPQTGMTARDDLLTAILDLMNDDTYDTIKQTAMEWAAIRFPTATEKPAQQILERMRALGMKGISAKDVKKQIESIGDQIFGNKSADLGLKFDAKVAAKGFLDSLAAKCLVDEEATDGEEGDADDDTETAPMLRYFREDFYLWQKNRWVNQNTKNFGAQVMAYLQSTDTSNPTERMTKDVMVNLSAMTNIPDWGEQMPFMVTDKPKLTITRPRMIVFENGILDLDEALIEEKPKLKPISRSYFNTIVLPYKYDPDAKCPLFRKVRGQMLKRIGDNDHRLENLQEFMGYTLLPTCQYQKMLIMYGKGGNGKSVIFDTWVAMLGEENVSAIDLSDVGKQFRLYRLENKSANFSRDFNYLEKIDEGTIKLLVTGEAIDADRKYKDSITLKSSAKWIIGTNRVPAIQDTSNGMWDRMLIMPFHERFRDTDAEDRELTTKLKAELPGIFNYAIRGLKRLIAQNGFTQCEVCSAFLNQHHTESDSVRLFGSECLIRSEGARTSSLALYDLYRYWCQSTGKTKPVAKEEFGKRMKSDGWIKSDQRFCGKKTPCYQDMWLSDMGEQYRRQMTNGGRTWSNHTYNGFTPICRRLVGMPPMDETIE